MYLRDNMSLKKVQDTVTTRLDSMIATGKDPRAFMLKIVRPAYQAAQRKRFATENQSEGQKWSPLNSKYAEYKLKKFKDFPGGGRKINIATGKLVNSLLLQDATLVNELVTHTSYVISIKVPYAKYVDEARPIMQFRKQFTQDLKKQFTSWMLRK